MKSLFTDKEGYQICRRCKKELPATLEFYYSDPAKKNGCKSECITCCRERSVAKKFDRYDVDEKTYNKLLVKQGYKCRVCGRRPFHKSLAVDHDHKTGKVRGLLCTQCNVALGHLGDSPERCRALADYLEGK